MFLWIMDGKCLDKNWTRLKILRDIPLYVDIAASEARADCIVGILYGRGWYILIVVSINVGPV